MKSNTILNLLLCKHSDQLCVPECKTGSQWTSRQIRQMDLWVMNKSWTKNWTMAYEIKVSRQDFLRDEKWREYLPFCNYFYFAAPPGIIQPEELSAEAGLLIGSKNLKKLYMKKKAPYREVEIPERLWRYILMWRVNVIKDRNNYVPVVDNAIYWREWLAMKKEDRDLGHCVSKNLQQLIRSRINDVEKENQQLIHINKMLGNIKEILIKSGIDEKRINNVVHRWHIEQDFKKLLAEVRTGLPENTMDYLSHTINNLTRMQKVFERRLEEQQIKIK